MPSCLRCCLVILFVSFLGLTRFEFLSAEDHVSFQQLNTDFEERVLPLLQRFCLDCHSTETHEGELDLERFVAFSDVRRDPSVFEQLVVLVTDKEMPPKESPQLSESDRAFLLDWAKNYLNAEALTNAGDPGQAVLRRLNNAELTYTIHDLTHVDLNPAENFPVDGAAGEGFTNTGASLSMSPALIQKYLDAGKSVAEHLVLLPDGFRFSESTARRDWEDEILLEIWKIYARHTSGATDASLLNQWNQDAMKSTANDGRVDLTPYFQLLLEHHQQILHFTEQDVLPVVSKAAEERRLSPKYTRLLAKMLSDRSSSSVLLNELRRQFLTPHPGSAAEMATYVRQWADQLWRFQSIGHLGLVQRWEVPASPVIPAQQIAIQLSSGTAETVDLYLTATSLEQVSEEAVIEWQNPRIERPGLPPISLRDIPAAVSELPKLRDEIRVRLTEYLAAADHIRRQSEEVSFDKIAAERNLDPLLLSPLLEFLGIENTSAVVIQHHFPQCLPESNGYDFVKTWVEPNASALSLVGNASDETVNIPGTLGPHHIAVHPRPERWVAAGWLSPITGKVTITPHVADAHSACGNGIAWRVESRRGSQRRILRSGEVELGGRATIEPIVDVSIEVGDLISLVIDAKNRDYVCDLTEIDLAISETTGEHRTWGLAKDCADDLAAGNPHADRLGNPNVWHFYWGSVDDQPTVSNIPQDSLLAQWLDARTSEDATRIARDLQNVINSPQEFPADSSQATIIKSLSASSGDVLSRVNLTELTRRLVEDDNRTFGLSPGRFGGEFNGTQVAGTSLVISGTDSLKMSLPAELCTNAQFVVTGLCRQGAAQLSVSTSPPAPAALQPTTPIVAAANSPAAEQLETQFRQFRDLFPAAMCHARIVPVDEVVTLLLFHREDDYLQKLMLSDEEIARLNHLWEELYYVSRNALRIQDSLEQILEFSTQDADPRRFDPVLEPIAEGARRYKQQLVDSEPHHLSALLEFADRAYRRPLTLAEREGFKTFYELLRRADLPHEAALHSTLVRVLTSPAFLFHLEQRKPVSELNGATAHPVSADELASRLSFFLWSSLPDQELRDKAANQSLLRDDVLIAATHRLLKDERTRRLAIEFGCQWLHIHNFDELDEKSEKHFPEFTDLRDDMYEESIRFFTDFFQSDRSILSLIDADYAFVNGPMAKLYGLDVEGPDWRMVENVRHHGRGGILALATTLTRQSGASRTSPILRGTWISESLLGERLPKPPKNVPQLPDDDESLASLSVRELIMKHSSDPACAKCHAKFDGYGFALERYDAIGTRRTHDRSGQQIETTAELPDGTQLDGIDSLRDYLLTTRRDDFVRQFCKKLLGYALGRGVQLSDQPLLDDMLQELEENDYRISVAIEKIVTSPQFRNVRGRD